LKRSGLTAQFVIASGNPSAEIMEEAERWGADAIFVGARGHRPFERALMGSVSNVVAMEAICSVEVVRLPGQVRR
jgi:nucleotide-binding universal stress UspA family protein